MDARDNHRSPTSRRWQFSVRAMLILILACSVGLAMFLWFGPQPTAFFYFSLSFLVAVAAAYFHRKRLFRAAAGGVILSLVVLGLVRYAPATCEHSACRICGKYRVTRTNLGLTWYQRERESEASIWYRQRGLPEHAHQWTFLSSWEQPWGGKITNYDSFGFFLIPLRRLQEVSAQVDQQTFDELVEQYLQSQLDTGQLAAFMDRCDQLAPSQRGQADPGLTDRTDQ